MAGLAAYDGTGHVRARPTMSELSSVGQDSARQSETEQHQSAPGEAEKDRAGRQKVGQC